MSISFVIKGLRWTVYLLLPLALSFMAYSQKSNNDIIYLLDKNWKAVRDMDKADYFMQLIKDNDTTYTCRYYNKEGPMIKQEVFMDEDLTIPHGLFCWYNAKGDLDSMGRVYRGEKHGYWSFYNDSNKVTLSVRYNMGSIFEKKDYISDVYTDSSGNTSSLSEKEKRDHELFIADSIAGRLQRANFGKNGKIEWQKYMNSHVKPSDRFAQIFKTGCCTVISSFLVDTTGNITEVYLTHSCEWSADATVISAVQKSPKWNPTIRNGKPVIYRQKQAISFCAHVQ
jgi:antitoxin component YwqK of YwqJK toxin-antitoxin module